MIRKDKPMFVSPDEIKKELRGYYSFPGEFKDVWEKVIEHETIKTPGKEKIRFGLGLGFSALLILTVLWAGFFSGLFNSRKTGIIAVISGKSEFRENSAGEWRYLKLTDSITEGCQIRTTASGYCVLLLPDRAVIRLSRSAELEIYRYNLNTIGLKLRTGKIAVNHTGRPGSSFTIDTPLNFIRTIGTKFIVSIDPGGNTEISVGEGSVIIQPGLYPFLSNNNKIKMKTSDFETVFRDRAPSFQVNSGKRVIIGKSASTKLDQIIGNAVDLNSGGIGDTNKLIALMPEMGRIWSNFQEGRISEDDKYLLDGISPVKNMPDRKNSIQMVFDSYPEGADVSVSNSFSGITPYEALIEKGRTFTIVITASNYETWTTNISSDKDLMLRPVLKNSTLTGDNQKEIVPPLTIRKKKTVFAGGYFYFTEKNRLEKMAPDGADGRSVAVRKDSAVLTGPVLGQDQIYIGSDNGGLYAYDLSGNLNWTAENAGKVIFNAYPIAGKEAVYLPTLGGGIEVYKKNGKLDYRINTGKKAAIYAAPLLLEKEGILVYGTENGDITGYSLTERKEIWSIGDFGDRIVYPLVGGDKAIAVLSRNNGILKAYNPLTGSRLWQLELNSMKKTDLNPVYFDDKIIVSINTADKSIVTEIDCITGKILREMEYDEPIFQPAVWNNKILISTISGKIIPL